MDSSAQNFWKLLSKIDYYVVCISENQSLVWLNDEAKTYFNFGNKKPVLNSLKKYFNKEDFWIFTKCLADSANGQIMTKAFDITNDQNSWKVYFAPVDFSFNEKHVLVLIRPTPQLKKKNEDEQELINFLIHQHKSIYVGRKFQDQYKQMQVKVELLDKAIQENDVCKELINDLKLDFKAFDHLINVDAKAITSPAKILSDLAKTRSKKIGSIVSLLDPSLFPNVSMAQIDLEVILGNLLDLFEQLGKDITLSISSQQGRRHNELHFHLKGPDVNDLFNQSMDGVIELKMIKSMLESKNGLINFEGKKDCAKITLKMPTAA